MSSQLAQLQEDRDQYQEQLDLVLSSLRDDPGNSELLLLKEELESALQIITDSIAEIKPAKKRNSPPPSGGAAAPPSSSNAHHSSDAHYSSRPHDDSASSSTPPQTFKVNESVLARWVSGDKVFYPARIMSVTGSATAPMYTIKFKTYDTIETLRAKDVRPLTAAAPAASAPTNGNKRKADGSSVDGASTSSSSAPPPPSAAPANGDAPPPPPPTSSGAAPPPPAPFSNSFRTMDRFSSGVVSSAAAQLYPQALEKQQQEASGSNAADEGPAPKKFKKIKAKKQLEAGKSKWQEFNNKSKFGKSAAKKDSMFRTPEGIHGRVGFTGSGQAMRKDPTRSRHVYQTNDELD